MRVIVGVTEFKAEFSGMLDLHKRFVCKEFNIAAHILNLNDYSKSGLSITVVKMNFGLNGKRGPQVPELGLAIIKKNTAQPFALSLINC